MFVTFGCRIFEYTPEQNGRAEREMRTIIEFARSVLYAKNIPKYFWAEAVNGYIYPQ